MGTDSQNKNAPSREERLAARLRDNLKRRKAQARAIRSAETDATDNTEADRANGATGGADTLPKSPEDG